MKDPDIPNAVGELKQKTPEALSRRLLLKTARESN